MRKCVITGCGDKHYGKNYCLKHYKRFKRYGCPTRGQTFQGEPLRFLKGLIGCTDIDCVEWPYATNDTGYGFISYEGVIQNAARVSLIISGILPIDNSYEVGHKAGICHNRICVNPNHLRWVTVQENAFDRSIDGTENKGSKNNQAKLDESDVLDIRNSLLDVEDLTEFYNVSRVTIIRVLKRETWKHI